MSRLVSDALNECSRMLVNHTGWGYLDKMPIAEQLEVIQTYNNDPRQQESKYIVVVFEKDERRVKYEKRCEELGLNQVDESDYSPRTEEMED